MSSKVTPLPDHFIAEVVPDFYAYIITTRFLLLIGSCPINFSERCLNSGSDPTVHIQVAHWSIATGTELTLDITHAWDKSTEGQAEGDTSHTTHHSLLHNRMILGRLAPITREVGTMQMRFAILYTA